jgi:hypothetical protein
MESWFLRGDSFFGEQEMSMSSRVIGIKPPDEKWKQMKVVWDACKSAHVNVPKEVYDYFGDSPIDDKGVVVDLEKIDSVVNEYLAEGESGFEVDLSRLPKDIKVIRFVNSW